MTKFTGFVGEENDIPVITIDGGNRNTDTLSDGKPLDAFDKGFLDYASSTAKNFLPSGGRFLGSKMIQEKDGPGPPINYLSLQSKVHRRMHDIFS